MSTLRCEHCKKDFDTMRNYQRHFGFKNAEETNHKKIREAQEKIAIELFNTDVSGDTFHILKTHPEINLISEKRLRALWRASYGTEAIEKRRASISFTKRNVADYEPARQRKLERNPNKCEFCDYRYADENSYVHHLGAMSDEVHQKFLDEQEAIIIEIYRNDLINSHEKYNTLYPQIRFGQGFIYSSIRKNFTKEQMRQRKFELKSRAMLGNVPWNTGKDMNSDDRLLGISNQMKDRWESGGYENAQGGALSKTLVERHKNNPDIAKRQSQTMKEGFASGRIKVSNTHGGLSKELGHYVRSSWELNFGRILKNLDIEYQYEPEAFAFRDENNKLITTYTPDFFVPSKGKNGVYYEVKGIFNSAKNWGKGGFPRFLDAAEKISLFRKNYPHLELRIIATKEYNRLMKWFKNSINENKSAIEIPIINGEISIPQKQWKEMNVDYEKGDIKKVIVETIRKNNVELPFSTMSIAEASDDFNSLKSLDTNELLDYGKFECRYPYKYDLLGKYIKQCRVGNASSNYFQQPNRLICDSMNSPSPARVWGDDKLLTNTLNGLWSMKTKQVDGKKLRELLSIRRYIASQFKPSAAKYIYNTYGNKGRVLDFSAGWGDRLAGFCASDCSSYTGIDPNKAVFDKYFEQKALYATDKEIILFNAAAEDVKLEGKYDLIFTSPPFFDQEKYTYEDNQSWIRYKTLDDWLNGFLFKTIDSFWHNLNDGGHLILNVSDVYSHHTIQHICDPMNDFISTLPGASYKGALGMRLSRRPNSSVAQGKVFADPLWIWQKTQ